MADGRANTATCNTLVKKQTVAKATLTTRKSFWLTDGSLPAAEPDEEEEEGEDEEEEEGEEGEAAVDETLFITAVVKVVATLVMMDGAVTSSDIMVFDGVSCTPSLTRTVVTSYYCNHRHRHHHHPATRQRGGG